MEAIHNFIIEIINSLGIYGAIIGCFIIFIESIIPIIPMGMFITINFLSFGYIIGFIISWIFTLLGCVMSFYLFRKGIQCRFNILIRDKDRLKSFIDKFSNIKFSELVILTAIPFTPAFLVNIAAGLSKMKFKKFIFALMIGKISLVYFWGFIGVSIVESLKDPMILLRIIFLVLASYIVSLLVNKRLKL